MSMHFLEQTVLHIIIRSYDRCNHSQYIHLFLLISTISRLPFDWNTSLLGYVAAFGLNVVVGILTVKNSSFLLPFFIESLLILSEFSQDIKREIVTLNGNWRKNQNQKELRDQLCEIICFNIRINELSL